VKFLKSLPKEKLQQLILTVIIGLIGIGVVFNFYVLKQINELSASRAQVKTLITQISDAQKAAKIEAGNAALREQFRSFLNTQEERMVQGDSFSWLIREFALLSEKHPVRVAGLNPGTTTAHPTKPAYELYTTRFEVTGTFDDVGVFLRDLENSFPTCSIKSLGIVVADAARGECRANLDLTFLVRPKSGRESTGENAETRKKTNA
jgi:Tfp pilus assembly protein PilO